MGLLVEVYRSDSRDCSNGGISSFASSLCLVNADGPFSPSADCPAAEIVPGPVEGQAIIRRVGGNTPGMIGPMFGGAFAYSCDSRFSAAVRKVTGHKAYGAVAIHDRFETAESYASLRD
jgi:hypothetical protein